MEVDRGCNSRCALIADVNESEAERELRRHNPALATPKTCAHPTHRIASHRIASHHITTTAHMSAAQAAAAEGGGCSGAQQLPCACIRWLKHESTSGDHSSLRENGHAASPKVPISVRDAPASCNRNGIEPKHRPSGTPCNVSANPTQTANRQPPTNTTRNAQ